MHLAESERRAANRRYSLEPQRQSMVRTRVMNGESHGLREERCDKIYVSDLTVSLSRIIAGPQDSALAWGAGLPSNSKTCDPHLVAIEPFLTGKRFLL